MLEAVRLSKRYGGRRGVLAVSDASFTVQPGQVIGFLGPNGAGKSTTLRMLVGYLPPTAGEARICGFDPLRQSRQAAPHLGYLPEANPLPPELRCEEYLHHMGRLVGLRRQDRRRRVDAVIDRCGLEPVRRRLLRALSKGNRQRAGLAAALVHEPDVLVLDEPTNGLDPGQMSAVRGLIRELAAGEADGRPRAVLLSTHLLPEVQRVADGAVVIARGRVVAAGSLAELRQRAARLTDTADQRWLLRCRGDAAALDRALGPESARVAERAEEGDAWRVGLVGLDDGAAEAMTTRLVAEGCGVFELRREGSGLEGLYASVVEAPPPDPAPEALAA